jgi:hypothetical protein
MFNPKQDSRGQDIMNQPEALDFNGPFAQAQK